MPPEGQGERPHAACPGSCSGKTGGGEREQKRRVSSWGQGSWGAPRSSALCWAGLAPAPPAPHRAVPGQQEGAGSCSGGCGAGPCRAGGIHRVTAPKKRNPRPGRELLALGTLQGPVWGSHQGGGPTRLHITPSSPAHPNCWCRTPQPSPACLQQLSEAKASSWAGFRGNQAIPAGQSMISCSLLPHAQRIYKKAEADYVN